MGRGEEIGGEGTRREGRGGDPKVASHPYPDVRNPEKYPDCKTDLIGGAATQTFAPGGKHPRAATAFNSRRVPYQ